MTPNEQVDELTFTDEELTELALAADPSEPVNQSAVPIDVFLGQHRGPLPEWYMAPPRRRLRPALVPVVWTVVGAFVAIEAAGLCSTYGQLFH